MFFSGRLVEPQLVGVLVETEQEVIVMVSQAT